MIQHQPYINPRNTIAKSKDLGGSSLSQHINDLNVVAGFLLGINQSLIEKINSEFFKDGKDFYELLLESIKVHDDGKGLKYWQNWAKNPRRLKMKRHEYMSVLMYLNELILEQRLAILCHHGNFLDDGDDGFYREKINYATFLEKGKSKLKTLDLFYDFEKIANRLMNESSTGFNNKKINSEFIKFNTLRGWLQICDKTASYLEAHQKYSPYFHKYLNKIFKRFDLSYFLENTTFEFRPIQKAMIDRPYRLLTIIRAVPGEGKTPASYIWANNNIKNNKADRLVFTLPTKFTTNQITDTMRKQFGNIPVAGYHGDVEMGVKEKNKNVDKNQKSENLFDFFLNKTISFPVSVRTLDSVVYPFRLLNEDHNIALSNLYNSCVVIDEVDFYNSYAMCAIHFFLEKCRDWKVPVLIMSASFPKSHLSFYKEIYGDDFDEKIDFIQDKSRNKVPKVRVSNIVSYTKTKNKHNLNSIKNVLNKAIIQDTIIYANTSSACYHYYKYFTETLKVSKDQVIMYNKNYIPEDRRGKEEKIIALLGRNKHLREKPVIVIMTQVGEMSLDISCDYMISEICPINVLYQRVGRLKRFSLEVGDLDIICPKYYVEIDKSKKYGDFAFPYVDDTSDFDNKKKRFIPPSIYHTKTLNLILKKGKNRIFTYGELNEMVDSVYDQPLTYNSFHEHAKNNTKVLYEDFNSNFLYRRDYADNISKEKDLTEEEDHFNIRGIRNVSDVFVEMKDEYESKYEFEMDYHKNSVLSVLQNVANNNIFETKEVKYKKKKFSFVKDEIEEDGKEIEYRTCKLKVLKDKNLYNKETGLNKALYDPEIQKKFNPPKPKK